MKKCRVNSSEGIGVRVGAKCPADLMQNAFEHNEVHLFVDAPWFPAEKDMINISNAESDDEFRVTSRLNTIKSTKTWSKGRRYSLHGTQNFMDALGAAMKEDEIEEKEKKALRKTPAPTPKNAGAVASAVKAFGGLK